MKEQKKKIDYYSFRGSYKTLSLGINENGAIVFMEEFSTLNGICSNIKIPLQMLDERTLKGKFKTIIMCAINQGEFSFNDLKEFFSKLKDPEKGIALETIAEIKQEILSLEFDVQNDELFKIMKEKYQSKDKK